jgi:hypothetical protein
VTVPVPVPVLITVNVKLTDGFPHASGLYPELPAALKARTR